MTRRPPSLRLQLITRQLLVQLLTLVVTVAVLVAFLVRIDSGGHYTDESLTDAAAAAILRNTSGDLTIQMTPELEALHKERPQMWFVARDDHGSQVSFGDVPSEYLNLAGALGSITYADLRDSTPPYRLSAVIRRETSAAGELTILGHGKVNSLTLVITLAANSLIIPVFVVLGLLTTLVTLWIVRRSLRGMSSIAREAEAIDVDRRGNRLTETNAPREIAPLVRAVNAALSRLDEGYERQRRFISSAAHELRTPIAVMRAKLEASGDITARRMTGDVARLSTLAEQLLDLHRLDNEPLNERVDLGALARLVAADLAPLLIAANKTVEVIIETNCVIDGNIGAMERVVTNLVQNAVEHGGETVVIRVLATGFEVEDDGPGIPPDEREKVFEPFHRLRPRSSGSGLGLNLVQQVVARHGGHVRILGSAQGGTIVRAEFLRCSAVRA